MLANDLYVLSMHTLNAKAFERTVVLNVSPFPRTLLEWCHCWTAISSTF